jgi:putative membrane protein insertion efficiency factor
LGGIRTALGNGGRTMAKRVLIGLVRAYRLFISPLLGASCRFQPTCSNYMIESINRFGALHGTWLGIRRISRCHPWHKGGLDPVPELKKKHTHNG